MKSSKTPWAFTEFNAMKHTYYNVVRFSKDGKAIQESIFQIRAPEDSFLARKLKENLLFLVQTVNKES
jgi:hypothetical protein